jgi:hypothetical protein
VTPGSPPTAPDAHVANARVTTTQPTVFIRRSEP